MGRLTDERQSQPKWVKKTVEDEAEHLGFGHPLTVLVSTLGVGQTTGLIWMN